MVDACKEAGKARLQTERVGRLGGEFLQFQSKGGRGQPELPEIEFQQNPIKKREESGRVTEQRGFVGYQIRPSWGGQADLGRREGGAL